jgi:N-acetyl-gamma-glutamyl-phosphate reductase
MVNVSIFGATGYTGYELIKILLKHPEVEIHSVTSERMAGKYIDDHHKSLRGVFHKKLESVDSAELIKDSDIIFMCFPPAIAMGLVSKVSRINKKTKIIDLSGDHRLDDVAIYEKWYKVKHKNPGYVGSWVYGLPETNKQKIKKAQFIANPGCYPTGVLLGLAPLMTGQLIDFKSIIIDSKSGLSGAGRSLSEATHYTECNGSVKAYGIGTHKHTPEIEQELSKMADKKITTSFTPHLVPMTRGILSTMYASLRKSVEKDDVIALYKKFYKKAPFVRVTEDGLPETKFVYGSNYCDVGMVVDERTNRIVVVSAIDNLIKGASGQAVQNMNIMQGYEEATGLDNVGTYP